MQAGELQTYFSNYTNRKKTTTIQTKKGEFIVFEEHQTSHVYVVKRGILKMSSFLHDGNEFNIKFITAGNIVTLLEDEYSPVVEMPFTVKTLSPEAEIDLLDRLTFWQDAQTDALLDEYIRYYYRRNLNFQIRKTCALASNGKFGAVCAQLYELQGLFGRPVSNGQMIDLAISNEELAKFCGITCASSFNRILRRLKEMDIVTTDHQRIIIKEPTLLKKFFS